MRQLGMRHRDYAGYLQKGFRGLNGEATLKRRRFRKRTTRQNAAVPVAHLMVSAHALMALGDCSIVSESAGFGFGVFDMSRAREGGGAFQGEALAREVYIVTIAASAAAAHTPPPQPRVHRQNLFS